MLNRPAVVLGDRIRAARRVLFAATPAGPGSTDSGVLCEGSRQARSAGCVAGDRAARSADPDGRWPSRTWSERSGRQTSTPRGRSSSGHERHRRKSGKVIAIHRLDKGRCSHSTVRNVRRRMNVEHETRNPIREEPAILGFSYNQMVLVRHTTPVHRGRTLFRRWESWYCGCGALSSCRRSGTVTFVEMARHE